MSMIMDPYWVTIAIFTMEVHKIHFPTAQHREDISLQNITMETPMLLCTNVRWYTIKTIYLDLNSHSKMHFYIRLWLKNCFIYSQVFFIKATIVITYMELSIDRSFFIKATIVINTYIVYGTKLLPEDIFTKFSSIWSTGSQTPLYIFKARISRV